MSANFIAPDGTPHLAASHLGISVCLCPNKKDRRLMAYWQEVDVRLSNFCFLDTDCLMLGGSLGSSRRSAGKYPVKRLHRKVAVKP